MRDWSPALTAKSEFGRLPQVGWLIGLHGKAYTVAGVEELSRGNWSEQDEQEWSAAGHPDPWARAPMRVHLTGTDGKAYGIRIGSRGWVIWHRLPEHYAVCATCGDLAPCQEYTNALAAEAEIERAVKAMQVPDGMCPACSQPITRRQAFHVFPGPNLLNPFGASPVRFHARKKCAPAAASYEEKWVNAEPRRQRSDLTLVCEGALVQHADGSRECIGKGDEPCPGINCRHRLWARCYVHTPGGCARCQP